jgi:uncharacterized protein (DUF58 family)
VIHPTRRCAWLATVPVAASAAAIPVPELLPGALALDVLLLALLAGDAGLAWWRARRLAAVLSAPPTWSLGRTHTVAAAVEHRGRVPLRVALVPDLPLAVRAEQPQRQERLPGRSRAEIAWRCSADRRGRIALRGVHAAVQGPLGLAVRHRLLRAPIAASVYPDLRQVAEFDLLARADRLALIGVRTARRGGGETEFDRLRTWRPGDPIGRMDWKATARRDEPVCREYRTSRSQNLILLVDAGRMMAARSDAGRTLLDHAVDAALLLAWAAVRQGDKVGLVAYADGVRRWVRPDGGPGQVNRIVHALHDLEAEAVESRHEDAFLHLDRHERKRSLVVLVTHVLDEVNAGHLERHCRRLGGRHLPLAVLLRDPDLHRHLPEGRELVRAAAGDGEFWRAGAAATVIHWRQQVIDRLRAHGALAIDTAPERLGPELVTRYLEIKARNLL